jgi:hypothetical protein
VFYKIFTWAVGPSLLAAAFLWWLRNREGWREELWYRAEQRTHDLWWNASAIVPATLTDRLGALFLGRYHKALNERVRREALYV